MGVIMFRRLPSLLYRRHIYCRDTIADTPYLNSHVHGSRARKARSIRSCSQRGHGGHILTVNARGKTVLGANSMIICLTLCQNHGGITLARNKPQALNPSWWGPWQ